jgi:hypothetical protein
MAKIQLRLLARLRREAKHGPSGVNDIQAEHEIATLSADLDICCSTSDRQAKSHVPRPERVRPHAHASGAVHQCELPIVAALNGYGDSDQFACIPPLTRASAADGSKGPCQQAACRIAATTAPGRALGAAAAQARRA